MKSKFIIKLQYFSRVWADIGFNLTRFVLDNISCLNSLLLLKYENLEQSSNIKLKRKSLFQRFIVLFCDKSSFLNIQNKFVKIFLQPQSHHIQIDLLGFLKYLFPLAVYNFFKYKSRWIIKLVEFSTIWIQKDNFIS